MTASAATCEALLEMEGQILGNTSSLGESQRAVMGLPRLVNLLLFIDLDIIFIFVTDKRAPLGASHWGGVPAGFILCFLVQSVDILFAIQHLLYCQQP